MGAKPPECPTSEPNIFFARSSHNCHQKDLDLTFTSKAIIGENMVNNTLTLPSWPTNYWLDTGKSPATTTTPSSSPVAPSHQPTIMVPTVSPTPAQSSLAPTTNPTASKTPSFPPTLSHSPSSSPPTGAPSIEVDVKISQGYKTQLYLADGSDKTLGETERYLFQE